VNVRVSDSGLYEKDGLVYYTQSPFSGKAYDLDENGDTLFTSWYLNGKREGLSTYWYSKNHMAEVRRFVNGKREGIHAGWWPNGKKKFIYKYSNDLLNGLVYQWYANGQMYKRMNYKEGYEDGMQRLWMQDGAIQANYEYRHGRKYGLTGVKNCSNVKDSLLSD